MYGLITQIKTSVDQRDALIRVLLQGASGMPGCVSYIVAKDTTDSKAIWITDGLARP